MAASRKYQLFQDFYSFPSFGLDDGTQFYGIIPRNIISVSNANRDGSAAALAEMGVKDTDNFNLNALATYNAQTPSNTVNADQTITFGGVCKQVLLDNQGSSNKLYYEMADTAASTSSPYVAAGGVLVLGINSTKIHLYGQTPTAAVVRGWY